jgi:hypothetical protein
MTRNPEKKPISTIRSPKLADRDVREAAFACGTFEQVAETLAVPDLQSLLDGKPKLAAAFARGRFLRQVREIATETLIVDEEVDRFVVPALERGRFVEMLKRDRVVQDIWASGRALAATGPQRGLKRLADAGDARAISIYERLLTQGPAHVESVDWEDLTPTQLDRATGIKRAQWLRWEKQAGCPRKGNRRYSLRAAIEWLREHEATGGVKLEHGLNPMQAEKFRRYKLENDEAEERLMPCAEVARLLAQRAARLMTLLSEARANEWAQAHEGKTAEQLKPLYLEAFRSARLTWKEVPDDVPLPERARALLGEVLALLTAE